METLKQKTQELSATLQKIGEYMYKQGDKDTSTGGSGTTGNDGKDNKDNKDEEPVEGEVVE